MTAEILARLAWAVLPSLLCAVVMVFFNKSLAKREKKQEEREEVRKKEMLLLLKMTFANGKLGYAAAMALKRGTPNGEVEDAIESYEAAKKEYNEFVNQQHVEEVFSK